jgi:succinate-semialdehyde dehydrogenase / glutarate-semialdehyde dehydrogenase
LAVAERLESGTVAVNRGLVSDPAPPFVGSSRADWDARVPTSACWSFIETQYTAIDR